MALYFDCPYKYYLSYVLNVKPMYKPEYEFGRTLHNIIKTYYSLIPSSITPKEVRMYLTQAVKRLNLDPSSKIPMLENFARFEEVRIASSINSKPLEVEKEFIKPPFKGVVDAIFMTSKGEYVVVDWKTSIRGGDEVWERLKLQGNIYMYLTNSRKSLFYGLRRGNVEEFIYDEEYLMSKYREFMDNVSKGVFSRRLDSRCYNCEFNIYCLSSLWGFEVIDL